MGEVDDLAVEELDLGRPLVGEVVGHGGACPRVDLLEPETDLVKDDVGQGEEGGKLCRRQRADARRPDACDPQHAQRLADGGRPDAAVVALRQFGEKRLARQRVDRVVEIDQKLAPGDRHHVGFEVEACGPVAGLLDDRAEQFVRLGHKVAGGALVPFAAARPGDVEADHAGEHLVVGQLVAQIADIGDAVLQAEHHRVLACMAGDLDGCCLGVGALDADGDEVGRAQGLETRLVGDAVRGKVGLPAGVVGEREAVGRNLVAEGLAAIKGDVEARQCPRAADEAADRAGPEDGDARQCHAGPPAGSRSGDGSMPRFPYARHIPVLPGISTKPRRLPLFHSRSAAKLRDRIEIVAILIPQTGAYH